MTSRCILTSVAALAAALASCRSANPILVDQSFADSTGNAPVLDSAALATEVPPHIVLALPDSVQDFEMTLPSALAIQPAGACILHVVDRAETATDYFAPSGRYLGTLRLGGRGRKKLSGLGRIGIAANGTSYVWELGLQRIVAIDPERKHYRVFQSDHFTASMPPLRAIQPVEPNRLIENWMTTSMPVASRNWAEEQLPLLRIIDTLGHYHGGLWRIADRPGQLLTHALNEGLLAMRGDTLWFAYAASGQIIRGTLNRAAEPWTIKDTARIVLPQMYRSPAPEWIRTSARDTMGFTNVDGQLRDFDVTEDGLLVVAQTISYPPISDRTRLHIASSALVVYDSAGKFVKGWRMGGRVWSLAVGRGYLATIVELAPDHKHQVRVFRLADAIPGEPPPADCTEDN